MNKKDTSQPPLTKEINFLTMDDLHACMELDVLTMKGLWTKEQWEKELSDQKRLCIGMFQKSNLIALGCGWLIIDEIHITAIAVHPNYQRRKLGEKIIIGLLRNAKIKGSKKAILEVSERNWPAIRLYNKLGFKTTGFRKNFYKDGSNAIIKWLTIN